MSNDKSAATFHDGSDDLTKQPDVQHGKQGEKQPEVQHSGPIGVVPVYAGGDVVPESAAAENQPEQPQEPAGEPDSSNGSADTTGEPTEPTEATEPPEPGDTGEH